MNNACTQKAFDAVAEYIAGVDRVTTTVKFNQLSRGNAYNYVVSRLLSEADQ